MLLVSVKIINLKRFSIVFRIGNTSKLGGDSILFFYAAVMAAGFYAPLSGGYSNEI